MNKPITFAFWGTDEFAVTVLSTLSRCGYVPNIVVTTPDKPQGRHMTMTPSPVKVWATDRNIKVLQPEKLKHPEFISQLKTFNLQLFIVASYGKIIPESVFDIPKYKTLNIHPSLLPLLRGPSPVATAILNDMKQTGVTIMQIDAQMDHGPILAQSKYAITEWPTRAELEEKLAVAGAKLLSDIIPKWIEGSVTPIIQNDSEATYTKFIEKEDAEINLNDNDYENFRKIQAYSGWPRAYTMMENEHRKSRVQITEARFNDGKLIIEKVIPEGKKEMSYDDFLRGFN